MECTDKMKNKMYTCEECSVQRQIHSDTEINDLEHGCGPASQPAKKKSLYRNTIEINKIKFIDARSKRNSAPAFATTALETFGNTKQLKFKLNKFAHSHGSNRHWKSFFQSFFLLLSFKFYSTYAQCIFLLNLPRSTRMLAVEM